MKIRIILIYLLVLAFGGYAQSDDPGSKQTDKKKDPLFKWENVIIDGNLGLQFGTYTFIDVSPVVAYKFAPKFIAGPGMIYRYFRYPWGQGSFYGWKFISRYYLSQQIFAHAEFEQLYIPDMTNPSNVVERRIPVNSLPIGIGYAQSAGPTGLYILIMYNLLDNPRSPYQNPIIRAGVTIGL